LLTSFHVGNLTLAGSETPPVLSESLDERLFAVEVVAGEVAAVIDIEDVR